MLFQYAGTGNQILGINLARVISAVYTPKVGVTPASLVLTFENTTTMNFTGANLLKVADRLGLIVPPG